MDNPVISFSVGWAPVKGATHYCLVVQPETGYPTAFDHIKQNKVLVRFPANKTCILSVSSWDEVRESDPSLLMTVYASRW